MMEATCSAVEGLIQHKVEGRGRKGVSATGAHYIAAGWRKKTRDRMAKGNYERALKSILKALEFDSADMWSHATHALVLYKLGRVGDAAEVLKGAVALDPHDDWFWEAYVETLCMEEKFQTADGVVGQARSDSESQRLPWALKGIIAQSHEQYVDSVEAFDKALEHDANYKRALVGKAVSLKKLRELEKDAIKKEHYGEQEKVKKLPEGSNGAVGELIRHPGLTIKEKLIDASSMSVRAVALEMGITPQTLDHVTKGKAPLSPRMAIKLSEVFPEYTAEEIYSWQGSYILQQEKKAMVKKPHHHHKGRSTVNAEPS